MTEQTPFIPPNVVQMEAAIMRIMRRLGIVGATYSEIADQVCKRLDGCELVIDKLKGGHHD